MSRKKIEKWYKVCYTDENGRYNEALSRGKKEMTQLYKRYPGATMSIITKEYQSR